jgi:hypothetical protein
MGARRLRAVALGAAALGLAVPAAAQAGTHPVTSSLPSPALAPLSAWHGTGPKVFFRPRATERSATSVLPEAEPIAAASRTERASRGRLRFGGGLKGAGVLHAPKVYLVFWGSGWSSSDSYATYEQRFFEGLYQPGDDWTASQHQYCDKVAAQSRRCGRRAPRPGYPMNGLVAGIWFDTGAVGLPTDVLGLGSGYDSVANEAVRAASHFGNTNVTANRDAVYVINEPPGRDSAGFGSAYCAYHSYVSSDYGNLPYVDLPHLTDVENSKHTGVSCGQNAVNPGAAGQYDGVSIVAGHEFSEAVTDPFPGRGWEDKHGLENADKCAWLTRGRGAMTNLRLVTGAFAVQSLWSNSARHGRGACVVHGDHGRHR